MTAWLEFGSIRHTADGNGRPEMRGNSEMFAAGKSTKAVIASSLAWGRQRHEQRLALLPPRGA